MVTVLAALHIFREKAIEAEGVQVPAGCVSVSVSTPHMGLIAMKIVVKHRFS